MKEILLQNGVVALCDDVDYPLLLDYHWNYYTGQTGKRYAYTKNKAGVIIKMHHLVLGYPAHGTVIDHINGNSLDNQRSNLRYVTKSINSFNSKVRVDNTTGFRGVHKKNDRPRKKPWFGKVTVYGTNHLTRMCWTADEANAERRKLANSLGVLY